MARRDAAPQQPPQAPYPPHDQQQQSSYPPQPYDQQQAPYGQPQQQYPPQQQPGGYPPHPQQDYGQQAPQYPPQQGQQPAPYPPPDQQQPGGYPPQQGQQPAPYPPPDQQVPPYPAPPDQQQHQQAAPAYPAPQDQQQAPYGQPQQQYPPQQQGYGGGYPPHVQPPPREPTMTGGDATAGFTPFCPHCGADVPDVGNPVCVQCLRPIHDQGGAPGGAQPVTMHVSFSSGEVQVNMGQELVLGRDPVHSPVAGTFSRFDNVSRRHATVGVDGNGQPWIRDERSTNGTFVNDRRLQPGEQVSLRDGDTMRLAADARGQIRLAR